MSNSLVSICIPSYNHARFLPMAIESALSQTYRNIEIVIVDDGSTDNSLDIAEDYATKHSALIKVFTHPNRNHEGISATVNLAFKKSKGAYWSGLPSDDLLCPDKIEAQVVFLKSHPQIGFVYGCAQHIDEDGRKLTSIFGTDISNNPNPIATLILENQIPGMTVLARRECLEKVGLHDEKLLYSDWEFWVRMLAHYKVGFLNRILANYRVHSYNTSMQKDVQVRSRHRLAVMIALQQKAPTIGGALSNPRPQALIDLQIASFSFHLGKTAEAEWNLASAFKTDPLLLKAFSKSKDLEKFLRTNISIRYDFASWFTKNLPKKIGKADFSYCRKIEALALAQSAFEFYRSGDMLKARRLIWQCLRKDLQRLGDRSIISMLAEMLAGRRLMGKMRSFKGNMGRYV